MLLKLHNTLVFFKDLKKRSLGNYILVLVFSAFIPFLEWLDILTHIQRKGMYARCIMFLGGVFGVTFPSIQENTNFQFFSDSLVYIHSGQAYAYNLFEQPLYTR
jgi:hypothetical protein